MPRLSRDVVAAREKLTLEMFRAGKNSDEVQKALQAGWNGMKMAPGRLAELQAVGRHLAGEIIINPPTIPSIDKPVEPYVGEALPDGLFANTVNAPATEVPLVVDESKPTKEFNPVAAGFLDYCKAKAKTVGHIIVDVSEEIYEEWLGTLKGQN